MDENATEQLLSNYYLGQKSPVDIGEASPLKRSRHPLGQIDGTRDSTTHGDYDRESGDDHDLSGDDLESRRPVKKLRPNN